MEDWVSQYWVHFGFGLIGSVITAIIAWMTTQFSKTVSAQKAVNNGVKALLRDRIIQAYNHYMERGECPIYALENVLALFKEYQSLGGNGVIERLVNELKGLPTEKECRKV